MLGLKLNHVSKRGHRYQFMAAGSKIGMYATETSIRDNFRSYDLMKTERLVCPAWLYLEIYKLVFIFTWEYPAMLNSF